MKILVISLALISLFYVIHTQTVSQCNPNYASLFPGELCSNTSFPVCEHGFNCYNNTKFSSGAPFCQAITNIKTPCNFTAQCTGVGLACIRNVCAPKRWAGEMCNRTDECLSLNCNSSGICQGYPKGTPCVASYDNYCGEELFCRWNGTFYKNGTAAGNCVDVIKENFPCVQAIGFGVILPRPVTDFASACEPGTVCDIALGKCARIGNATAGTNVTSSISCGFGGALAFKKGVGCVDYCGTGLNDPKCINGYYCKCGTNGAKGTCLADTCNQAKTDMISCFKRNKCRDVFEGPEFQSTIWRSLSNGTCIFNKCQQFVWDYECCLTNYGTRSDLTPGVSCGNFVQNSTITPIQSVSSTLSSCFLLLISVIFFIFVVYL